MDFISTITQKGQVVIPLPIRKLFGLKASDKLYFEARDGLIIAKPIDSIDEAMGMVRSKKTVSKKEYKKTIFQKVLKKFR